MYRWNFGVLEPYLGALINGMLATIWISFLSIVAGTVVGILLAVARQSKSSLLRYPASLFIEVFLAMPVLVLLVWTYYCLPMIISIRLSGISTAVLVFSLSLAAYVAETVRSGIDAVPTGQVEAALSLQMTRIDTYRFIVLPQAIRMMLPALLTQYLTLIKLSTLASVIAVYELLHTANNIVSETYRPLEVYTAVAIMFVLLILPINMTVRRIESKWGRKGQVA